MSDQVEGQTVFWAWQDETAPGAIGKSFIKAALDIVLAKIRDDVTIEASPRLDHDTKGHGGAPEIPAAIMAKIDRATAVVCDVTMIVRQSDLTRSTPNPNVSFELGYAVARHGWDRIVLVMNEHYGKLAELPFDMEKRRACIFTLSPGETDRKPARNELQGRLENALRPIFASIAAPPPPTQMTAASVAAGAVENGRPDVAAKVKTFMTSLSMRLNELARESSRAPGQDDDLVSAIDAAAPLVVEFGQVAETIAAHDGLIAASAMFRCFEPILEGYTNAPGNSHWDTDYDFHKFMGHELFVTFVAALLRHERFNILADILSEELHIKEHGNPAHRHFDALADYVKLLDRRNERLNTNRVSLHADLLKQRHSEGHLGETCPFDEFLAAEYFLFLRSELAPERSPIQAGGHCWRPGTIIYLTDHLPTFVERARSRKYAQRLIPALGLADVESFRARYVERSPIVKTFFRRVPFFRLRDFDGNTLGTT